MIVVDTSALMAIILGEATGGACRAALRADTERYISAGTLAEALIVSARRNVRDLLEDLLILLPLRVVPVDNDSARQAADAYDRWGKGQHPANLNICDCFAYALAAARGCPLLYVGDDFARTDIAAAR